MTQEQEVGLVLNLKHVRDRQIETVGRAMREALSTER